MDGDHEDEEYEFIFPCAPEDKSFIDNVYLCGVYEGSKDTCNLFMDFIGKAEKVELDPENLIAELKGLAFVSLGCYERRLTKAKERIIDEY